jgi:hypothetical protein
VTWSRKKWIALAVGGLLLVVVGAVIFYVVAVYLGVMGYILAISGTPRGMNDVYVQNTSASTWMLRVPDYFSNPRGPLVIEIKPGADGIAYRVPEDELATLEVLDAVCALVEQVTVQTTSPTQVGRTDGLILAIRNHTGQNNLPEITETAACGGR